MRAPAEQHDLDIVASFLTTKGLEARRFTNHEARAGETPDYRVFRDGAFVGFCEVKSPRDERLDDAFDNALATGAPIVWAGFGGPDPTSNRIANLIHGAVKQLDAVNYERTVPNILFIVNWAKDNDIEDLEEVLSGHRGFGPGRRVPTMPNISEGRIRVEKLRIDAYVWMDGPTGRTDYLFTQSNVAHRDTVRSWFDITSRRSAG